MSALIATFFNVGKAPFAPGTFGSLAALPVAYLLHRFGGMPVLALAIPLVFLLGWWATIVETRGKDDHDPGEIVIDEVVGQWIALLPLSIGLWFQGADPAVFPYPGWITAFVAFRLFDILKPWPVSWADQKETAFGVMFDDVLAGIYAALVSVALALIFHLVIL